MLFYYKISKKRFNKVLYNIKITIFVPEIKSESRRTGSFEACLTKISKQMMKQKAGVIAVTIWNALNETEGMTAKQLKKATKLVDKDLFLGLGWLLREDKVSVEEVEGELFIKLI